MEDMFFTEEPGGLLQCLDGRMVLSCLPYPWQTSFISVWLIWME